METYLSENLMPFTIQKELFNAAVKVIETQRFPDDRGFFMESYSAEQFKQLGIAKTFIQDNHSCSQKGVLRGLHFQWNQPMAKLMRVTSGAAFLVAVDIRHNSPTLGQWVGIEASAENGMQLWAEEGFARGFYTLEEDTEIQYKCSASYNPDGECEILWNDPRIGIEWPLTAPPILSSKDEAARTLEGWLRLPEAKTFSY